MRYIGGIVAIVLLSLACPRLAAADDVEIKASHLKLDGETWFRRGAPLVVLGAYGRKATPLFGSNYLAVEARIPMKDLVTYGKIRKLHPVTVEWEKHKKTDVSGNFKFKYFGLSGTTALNGSYETFKSAKLKLVQIWIEEGAMENIIKHSAGVRNFLQKEGRDGRVVVALCVAMEAELVTRFENSTEVTLSGSGTGGVLKITAKQSVGSTTSGEHTIELPPDSVFAYTLAKVKTWNKDKTQVDLEDDKYGPE